MIQIIAYTLITLSVYGMVRIVFVDRQMTKAIDAINDRAKEMIEAGEYDSWEVMYEAFDAKKLFNNAMLKFWKLPSSVINIPYFLDLPKEK